MEKKMDKIRSISVSDNDTEVCHDMYATGSSYDDTNAAISASMVGSNVLPPKIDSTSNVKSNLNITHNIGPGHCRFPKLEECAHFHYERVQIGDINLSLVEDKSDLQSSTASQPDGFTNWFIIKVRTSHWEPFLIKRSFENLKLLDEMLHRCVYDRKISALTNLNELEIKHDLQLENIVTDYLNRFSAIASDSLTCGPILTWFQLDNKGRRLPLADSETMRSINTPAVGAAYGIRKYNAQACDEISIEVGDMISVIDMPSPAESTWWRGKKSHLQKSHYEVGFFPQSCVATIGEKVPRHLVLPAPLVGSLEVSSPTKPVLQKHGKLIAFFRSFILSRPSRRRLKQSGIYKERVFSCDLSEHLLNSGQDIPMVLRSCAEFIEEHGIVDGIYRLSGITSNIQKLRRCFDEERIPDLTHPEVRQDIHAMSSLLKMYFRELPNPLCTYQLYDNFVEAIQTKGDSSKRLRLMKETVQKLPPPHYRTLKYLATHLNKIGHHSARTGMTDRNLAIVWAPNLLRSPALESGGVAALRGVGVQAVVTEFLITNCHLIFNGDDDYGGRGDQNDSLTDSESIVEQRDHDQSLNIERPKSLSMGGAKLISLEEAQTRHNRSDFTEINKTNPINTPGGSSSYIEVGGGPSSLPDKYHTVLPVPRSWQKRKTHSWRSLFTRGQRNSNSEMKGLSVAAPPIVHPTLGNQNSQKEQVQHISLRGEQDKVDNNNKEESYDNKALKICVRSTSADSLRTAGHSRSVSHDSYFDLLQSPLRTVAASPSREFSELGINFDREEPEMRIFSESESLVSSPRVPMESGSRRIARCRTDDYASAMNNVNPSPKKQPRLNTPSPCDQRWISNHNKSRMSSDESFRKRYKLENQAQWNVDDLHSLSEDFQYIDSITPEHNTNPPTSTYVCVQVYNPPQSSSQRSSIYENCLKSSTHSLAKDDDNKYSNAKDDNRYSYPGMGNNFTENKRNLNVSQDLQTEDSETNLFSHNSNRYSYCDPKNSHRDAQSGINVVLRSTSIDVVEKNMNDRCKPSAMTPSSPSKSPRYSLLVGETSSENSSSLNTPVYETDTSSRDTVPTNLKSDGFKHVSGNSTNRDMNNVAMTDVDAEVSLRLLGTTNSCYGDNSDLRRELSLDLERSKMSIDEGSLSSNRQVVNISSTSTTPNFTHTSGNTSQSMTPSDFGYQHLNRQSNAVSLESLPKSDVYDHLEQVLINSESQLVQNMSLALTTPKQKSPIKSTINITYNVKSPLKTAEENHFFSNNSPNKKLTEPKDLLETNFDENMVYEQIHVFNNTISEINNMIDNGNKSDEQGDEITDFPSGFDVANLNNAQVVPNDGNRTENEIADMPNKQCRESPNKINENNSKEKDDRKRPEIDDVPMSDQELNNDDSLELDVSLYENVQLRKSVNVYENIQVNSNQSPSSPEKSPELCDDKIIMDTKEEQDRPSSFTVRELANKFQTSPNDVKAPFDFSKSYVKKSNDGTRNSPCLTKAKNQIHLHKSTKITRSLDENAFVREFGNGKLHESINRSVYQLPDIKNVLSENSPGRRLTSDQTRPKSLNPPKRLPELSIGSNEICKTDALDKEPTDSTFSGNFDLKITPTTENPISLIQQNVGIADTGKMSDDEKSQNSISSVKGLGTVKLDRDRIEKIKEERRLQLNEKFRSESFKCDKDQHKIKSKSKIELTDLKETDKRLGGSLQFKSKSRAEIYNMKDPDSPSALSLAQTFGGSCMGRIRRISDEKNQNACTHDYLTSDATMNEETENVATMSRKFERRPLDIRRDTDGFAMQKKMSNTQRDRISPQYSIRDVAAIFESRTQNQ